MGGEANGKGGVDDGFSSCPELTQLLAETASRAVPVLAVIARRDPRSR